MGGVLEELVLKKQPEFIKIIHEKYDRKEILINIMHASQNTYLCSLVFCYFMADRFSKLYCSIYGRDVSCFLVGRLFCWEESQMLFQHHT